MFAAISSPILPDGARVDLSTLSRLKAVPKRIFQRTVSLKRVRSISATGAGVGREAVRHLMLKDG
jgi:hypothetical protein